MKSKLTTIFASILVLSSAIHASEVDNFSRRDAPLADATVMLNKKANELIDESVDKANRRGSCDKGRLFKAVKVRFRNHYQDKFSKYVHHGKDVPRRRIRIRDGIYQDFNSLNSFVLGFMGKVWDTTAFIIKMGGHQFGTDKWEHFFGRGFVYYKMHVQEKKSLDEVLKFGLASEQGTLGALMTGVLSYGDLAANFKGMHFFNHLIGEGKDYLSFERPMGPYVGCVEGKWKRIAEIDLLPYVDSSWDEAVNCSLFRNEKLLNKVKKRLAAMGREYACPLFPAQLENLVKYYGPYASYVLNTNGNGVR